MKEVVVSNEAIEQSLASITKLHDKVSMEDTPRAFVKKKIGRASCRERV